MKVLMLGWELPPAISGGLGTACKGIADSLASNNINLTFVIPSNRGEKTALDRRIRVISADKYHPAEALIKKTTLKNGYAAKSYPGTGTSLSPYHTSYTTCEKGYPECAGNRDEILALIENQQNLGSILHFTGNYGKNLFDEVMNYSSVGSALGAVETFDVIHAHDWMTYPAGICAKKVSKKPLVIHVHATEYDRSWSGANREIVRIEKKGMEIADKIITVSHYTKNMVINKYGINPEKIEVVHNAVSKDIQFSRYQIRKNFSEKIVLFLGRITSQKGPEYFLEAAVKVLNKMNNVRFVMSGNGDLFPGMITKMAEYDIAEKFHFTGFLKGAEVEKIFAMSDLYIMPSVSEPFGLSPFEALLYDVPVIISNQSGAAEILTHAYKVDFWDTDKLAKAIISLLENEELRSEIVKECKEDIKSISWDTAGKRIAEIYCSLCGKTAV
ncbi:MAG: glycosyltransferase [Spirochaetia bacterium]|jgi:glycosyltransferase involved in cell wall biosynthesis|nr:glycosyltransferase [Spirochaetia bacterium]